MGKNKRNGSTGIGKLDEGSCIPVEGSLLKFLAVLEQDVLWMSQKCLSIDFYPSSCAMSYISIDISGQM